MQNYTSVYETFVSLDNLKLAWERVRYFDRLDSRDWIGLKVFAANRDHNLELLRQTLIARTFEPSYPEIKYLPKPSQTLRPMAVLAVSDRIVFQAIANVVAEKARPMLSIVANRQSFANVLSPLGEKRMFAPYPEQYRLFQRKFKILYEEGNDWMVETDMAAFYETIDHGILLKYLLEKNLLEEKTAEYLRDYLPIWSSVKSGEQITRGIPQGCLASDFFANLFVYEFDKDLSVQEYHYLRYVDDIRLLARTREAVQQGLIRIDRALKTLGLLIQTNKTMVRQISSYVEEADRMASKLSQIDRRLKELDDIPEQTLPDSTAEPSLHDVAILGEDIDADNNPLQATDVLIQHELVELFWQSKQSLDSTGSDPFAERHIKFCLTRLEPNPEVVDAILPYLIKRPWISEFIHRYLSKCELSKDNVEELKKIIKMHKVYDSTVEFSIDTLIRKKVSLRPLHGLFRKWLTDNRRDWALLSTAAMALGEHPDNMSVLLNVVSSSAYSPSVRRIAIIQALRLARDKHEAVGILKVGIHDTAPIVIDSLLYQLYVEQGLTILKLGLGSEQQLTEYCLASARGYDDSLPQLKQCYIRQTFIKFYGVKFPELVDFHALLGAEEHIRAANFLWQSNRSYLSNPTRYVSQLHLFHEELLYPIFVEKLKFKNTREEAAKIAMRNRIEMIQKEVLQKGEVKLGNFASMLLACNDLRAKSTESHTRLHGILDPTNPISWHERDSSKSNYVELTKN
ncbi:RNA-directed DNA polymerase [Trichocoleus sp. ST-U3]